MDTDTLKNKSQKIEALENIDSKKIELAYNNSLKFTSNQFYKSLKKLIGDNI